MSKTRRNRWTSDLNKRERQRLHRKDLNKTKAVKVRDRLEQRRADQLQHGEATE